MVRYTCVLFLCFQFGCKSSRNIDLKIDHFDQLIAKDLMVKEKEEEKKKSQSKKSGSEESLKIDHSEFEPKVGGVFISFDDTYCLQSWFENRAFLKDNEIEATFYLYKGITSKAYDLLKEGHELHSHTFEHVNVPKYSIENGYLTLGKNQINSLNEEFLKYNLPIPMSLALPFGEGSSYVEVLENGTTWPLVGNYDFIPQSSDAKLLEFLSYYYQHVRGFYSSANYNEPRCYLKERSEKQKSEFLFNIACGIDDGSALSRKDNLIKALEYARDKKYILSIAGHCMPSNKINTKYKVKMETLTMIANFVKKNSMKYFKASEL